MPKTIKTILEEHLDRVYSRSRSGLYTTKKREQEVRQAQMEWHKKYCLICKAQ